MENHINVLTGSHRSYTIYYVPPPPPPGGFLAFRRRWENSDTPNSILGHSSKREGSGRLHFRLGPPVIHRALFVSDDRTPCRIADRPLALRVCTRPRQDWAVWVDWVCLVILLRLPVGMCLSVIGNVTYVPYDENNFWIFARVVNEIINLSPIYWHLPIHPCPLPMQFLHWKSMIIPPWWGFLEYWVEEFRQLTGPELTSLRIRNLPLIFGSNTGCPLPWCGKSGEIEPLMEQSVAHLLPAHTGIQFLNVRLTQGPWFFLFWALRSSSDSGFHCR